MPLQQPNMQNDTLTIQFRRGEHDPKYAIVEKDGFKTILPLDRDIRDRQVAKLEAAGYNVEIVYDARATMDKAELKPDPKPRKKRPTKRAKLNAEQVEVISHLIDGTEGNLPTAIRDMLRDSFPQAVAS